MRLEDDIDFTTLNWVKPELDEALTRARQALEDYVEAPDNAGPMHACAAGLHQVQGTLRMVELYGAAMVVQEMERLVAALLEGQVPKRDDAYAALMRGLMQMPDYLERLQSGYRDIPVVLLPLLNDLRTCRGAEALHESELFQPNLESPLPPQAPGAPAPLSPDEQRREVTALRPRFQQPLLVWFRGQGGAAAMTRMRDTLDLLAAHCHTLAGRRLWWIAAGVLDGLAQGTLDAHGNEVKQLIGRVDRCIRTLIEQGEAALAEGEPIELEHKLLYYAARAQAGSARLQEVRHTYRLDQLLPDAVEVEHARSSMAGHNRELLDTVAQAIKDDLLSVKDALDLFLHQADGNPEQLAEQSDVLDRVGDTLGMLGLNVPRRIVGEQRGVIQDMAARTRPVDEDVLLDVAGALLYVEASLDDHIERLGVHGNEEEDEQALPRSEARQVMAALMREAVGNIDKVKDMLVAFIESPWDHAQVANAPALLEEVCGALGMVDAGRPVTLVQGIGRFINNELVVDARIPTADQMDKLADALASIEYYMEAAREHRGGLGHILDVTEQSLDQLGYWPIPPAREAIQPEPASEDLQLDVIEAEASTSDTTLPESLELVEPVSVAKGSDVGDLMVGESEQTLPEGTEIDGLRLAETESGMLSGSGNDDNDWVEVEEEIEEQVPVPDAMAARAGFQGASDEIDLEIREVFLEEVQEEIDAIQAQMSSWLQQPNDADRLTPIRRAFHTLKGSGRLVGAEVLGEFSWKIENMLNRVLDGTIEPHEGVQALVGHAVDALPGLLMALKGEGTPDAPLVAIVEMADRLAAGDAGARLEQAAKPQMQTVKRIVSKRVPRGMDEPVQEPPKATLAGVAAPEVDEGDAASTAPAVTDSGESLDMPSLPPMDPVLVDILRSEVTQHLKNIRASVESAHGGEVATDEPLLRAVHTLHGAIAMVDIPLLSSILSPLESWLKRLRALNRHVPVDHVDALVQSADLIEQVASQFDAARPMLPDASALARRIEKLRDDLPEPQMAHPLYDVSDIPEDEAVADQSESAISLTSMDEALLDPSAESEAPRETDHEAEAKARAEAEAKAKEEEEARARAEAQAKAEAEAKAAAAAQAEAEAKARAEAEAQAKAEAEAEAEAEAKARAEAEAQAKAQAEAEIAAKAAAQARAEQEARIKAEEEARAVADSRAEAEATLGVLSPGFRFPSDAQPEGTLELPDMDPELLDIFVEEGNDILDHADGAMAELRTQSHPRETLVSLQRDLHTLKGGARMAALSPIGDLAHAMESLLEALTEDRRVLNADVVESLERGFDYLHDMVQRASQRQALARPQQAIAFFETLVHKPTVADDAAVAEEASPAPSAPATDEAVETVDVSPAEPLRVRPELLPEQESAQHAPQEMIRVRSDLIDSLVNFAGEVSIYRARLEQQVSGFRFNLIEFDQTVTRLRDQLRKMEIETEAQIIARYQREHENQDGFDPLELDRFSQLQQYSRALAESVADLVSLQNMLDDNTRQSETLLLQQSRVSSELQEGLMRTRMVPFDSMVPTLRRTLRQAGQETGKRAQLQVVGAHGEMDRNLLERMKAPFEHMLRNA
ncbi:MAG TPA: cell envelope integrity protein TolA, partial [Oleiagrimonas sp.]|nr:cell envelope integrity protein TolA [Oleiagrimonas sp.]